MRTVALLKTLTRPMQFINGINEFNTLTGLPKYRVTATYFNCPQRMKSDIAIYVVIALDLLIPVASRSKAWVNGSSYAGIAGSNPAGGMDVSCECCVLSGTGFCVGLITRPEESYRMWCD